MRCDLLFKRASARGVKCWVWREALSYGLTHFRIAPLHTELDEGQWAFNRHDTQFDWELSRKASTLPPSKGRPRLCSSSPCLQSLLPLLMFLFRSLVLSMQCYPPPPHTHTPHRCGSLHGITRPAPVCCLFCCTIHCPDSTWEVVYRCRAWLVNNSVVCVCVCMAPTSRRIPSPRGCVFMCLGKV